MNKQIVALALACAVSGSSFANCDGDHIFNLHGNQLKNEQQQKQEWKDEAYRAGLFTCVATAGFSFLPISKTSPMERAIVGATVGAALSWLESRNSNKTIDKPSQYVGGAIGLLGGLTIVKIVNNNNGS